MEGGKALQWVRQPLTQYVELGELLDRINVVRTGMAGDVTFTDVIPSFVMGADGPTLKSILLFTETLIVDVSIARGKDNHEFDTILRGQFFNYRCRIWQQLIMNGDEVSATFELAELVFLIGGMQQFGVTIQYAGNERNAWLDAVKRAFPLSEIVRAG